jgi:hypothetical protein|tara:strand:- start:95 stop:298 length:204 start_codon:yes stop_codon:yes gene_type:complete
MEGDQENIKKKINELLEQHSELDDAIERINEKIPFDQIKLQRLKKRKLILKDEINKLKSKILPDIIA